MELNYSIRSLAAEIGKNPKEFTKRDIIDFIVEKGALHLRVSQLDEAIAAFQKALTMDDKNAPVYRMLGYCQALQKKNKEACANFAKAKELGDQVVDSLMEKYCK